MIIRLLFKLPKFLYLIFKDLFYYIKNKGWKEFNGFGIHLFSGEFGSGKTSMMIARAYYIACKYPQVTVLTNIKLQNFPKHTVIKELKCIDDILNSPNNTLVLIDEIGTIFNSRDFAGKNKDGLPKILFRHICQVRHNKKMIFGTTQRFLFVDKQIRDVCSTITCCKIYMFHPFSRLWWCKMYDCSEYEIAIQNPLYKIMPIKKIVALQTDFVRNLYDTTENVEQILSSEYFPTDTEVNIINLTGIDRKTNNKINKNIRNL